MEPGRELNELVAEKVMGWTKDDGKTWSVIDEHFGTGSAKETFVQGWIAPKNQLYLHESVNRRHVPDYSTNIAEAWKVMVELTRFNCCLKLRGDYNYRWRLELTMGYPREGDHKPYVSTECDTAPHAICLAALKAVEHKKLS